MAMIKPPFYCKNQEETVSDEEAHSAAVNQAKARAMAPVQQSIFLLVIYFMIRPGSVSLYSIYMVINQVQMAFKSMVGVRSQFKTIALPMKELLPYMLAYVGLNIGKIIFVLFRLYQALSSVAGGSPPALSPVPLGFNTEGAMLESSWLLDSSCESPPVPTKSMADKLEFVGPNHQLADVLAQCNKTPGLKELAITGCGFSVPITEFLAISTLKTLTIQYCKADLSTNAGSAAPVARLTSLVLNSAELDKNPSSLLQLSSSPALATLKTLDITGNSLGDTVLADLAAVLPSSLTHFSMGMNELTTVAPLAECSGLTHLNIRANRLTSSDSIARLVSRDLSKIVSISAGCQLGPTPLDPTHLFDSINSSTVESLDLQGCTIPQSSVAALARALGPNGAKRLKTLLLHPVECDTKSSDWVELAATLRRRPDLGRSLAKVVPEFARREAENDTEKALQKAIDELALRVEAVEAQQEIINKTSSDLMDLAQSVPSLGDIRDMVETIVAEKAEKLVQARINAIQDQVSSVVGQVEILQTREIPEIPESTLDMTEINQVIDTKLSSLPDFGVMQSTLKSMLGRLSRVEDTAASTVTRTKELAATAGETHAGLDREAVTVLVKEMLPDTAEYRDILDSVMDRIRSSESELMEIGSRIEEIDARTKRPSAPATPALTKQDVDTLVRAVIAEEVGKAASARHEEDEAQSRRLAELEAAQQREQAMREAAAAQKAQLMAEHTQAPSPTASAHSHARLRPLSHAESPLTPDAESPVASSPAYTPPADSIKPQSAALKQPLAESRTLTQPTAPEASPSPVGQVTRPTVSISAQPSHVQRPSAKDLFARMREDAISRSAPASATAESAVKFPTHNEQFKVMPESEQMKQAEPQVQPQAVQIHPRRPIPVEPDSSQTASPAPSVVRPDMAARLSAQSTENYRDYSSMAQAEVQPKAQYGAAQGMSEVQRPYVTQTQPARQPQYSAQQPHAQAQAQRSRPQSVTSVGHGHAAVRPTSLGMSPVPVKPAFTPGLVAEWGTEFESDMGQLEESIRMLKRTLAGDVM
ncbi:chromosome segregation protein [Carpediemonas membranifera]|uniref:ER membrane protein complex subunit 4 n=1 Tax=Carpediemonas membranifera TaxID=201153 RepID=A0A8J6BVP0_9EUKA|nr:chromosome segregation protein [Carpediemonas membranifera]|eukprot:KAG9391611.1 chromosome segregation protein [Carpediemonas membranifera]